MVNVEDFLSKNSQLSYNIGVIILLLTFLSLILLACAIFTLYLLIHAFYWIVSGVPFVGSRTKVLGDLVRELKLDKGRVFYDLGAGDGKVIFYLAKENPEVKFIGYELNPALVLYAKAFRRLPNVEYRRKNFFKVDLRDADYIFLFLFPELMEKILPKLKSELKSGSLIISNTFTFSNGPAPIKSFISQVPLESLYIYQL